MEPSTQELNERDQIVSDLQRYISQYFPKAELQLFGSSTNGFGFQHSDLDICLTFSDNADGKVRFTKCFALLVLAHRLTLIAHE